MKNGFSIIEFLIVVGLSSVLLAIAIPINSNSMIKAKMSESDSNLRKIRTQLRIVSNQTGAFPTLEKGSPVIGASWNNFDADDISGKYFDHDAYTVESTPTTFIITCETDEFLPFDRSIDQFGMLANVQ